MSSFTQRDGERTIRGAFPQPTITRPPIPRDQIASITASLLSPDYKSGIIKLICDGGLTDPAADNLPTGVIPLNSLRRLHHDFPEVDWAAIAASPDRTFPARLVYLAHTITFAARYGQWDPQPQPDGIPLLHLDSHKRVPLYAHLSHAGPSASALATYGLPAIFVSPVDLEGDRPHLSECSLDLLYDRRSQSTHYNRGLIYTVAPTSTFYFDRKANIAYRDYHLRRTLMARPHLSPLPTQLADHSARLTSFLEAHRAASDPLAHLALTQECSQQLVYSALNFCLFELTHEFASIHSGSLLAANRFLKDLAPLQARLWSMASFVLPSLDSMRPIFQAHGLSLDAYAIYCAENLRYKLHAFLGDNYEHADACARLFMFHRRYWDLRSSDPGGSLATLPLPAEMPRDAIHALVGASQGWCNLHPKGNRLVFQTAAPPPPVVARLRSMDLSPHARDILDKQDFKTHFTNHAEALALSTLHLLLTRRVGCAAIPLRPDTRGEMLLAPWVNDTLVPQVLRVTLSDSDPPTIVEHAPVVSRLRLHDHRKYDPTMARTFPRLYNSEPSTSEEAYTRHFHGIAESIAAHSDALLPSLRSKPHICVVIPYYKERRTYVDVAIASARAIVDEGFDAILLLATNQTPDMALESGLAVSDALRRAVPGHVDDVHVWHINTSSMSDLKQWMIHKFANVHAALRAVVALLARRVVVDRVVVLEGDVQNTGPWWRTIFDPDRPQDADLTLLQHAVRLVETEESKVFSEPTYDNSDSVLAELVAGPLTTVMIGTPLKHLFGGCYVLSPSAAERLAQFLDASDHSECLVETWLPAVMATSDRVHVVTVDPKVHLPTSNVDEVGVDGKVMTWVSDLFAAMQHYVRIRSETRPPHISTFGGSLVCNIVGSEQKHIERRVRRLEEWTLLRPVISNMLGNTLMHVYEQVQRNLSGVSHAGDRQTWAQQISSDIWFETVVRCFVAMRGKGVQEGDEMAAFRQLLDLRVLESHACYRRILGGDDVTPETMIRCHALLQQQDAVALTK